MYDDNAELQGVHNVYIVDKYVRCATSGIIVSAVSVAEVAKCVRCGHVPQLRSFVCFCQCRIDWLVELMHSSHVHQA